MTRICLTNIVKRYGDGFPAVNNVNLDIADGEFIILVGPSGSGKSTLLRMIVGLEDITSGELRIGDNIVNDLAPRDRNLAMVFQNYALYPHLSVYENIAFPLRLDKQKTQKEIDAAVRQAADMLDLNEHLNRKPSNLSGGQRQRVAMGRAIVRDADAFLFDEPLSNLDAKLRGQMRTEIARMQRRMGITTIYVTHDQTEAMTLGDRVAVLKHGTLQQVASPRELYEQPVNLFVAGFIGSPPMNFIPAHIEGAVLHTPLTDIPITPVMAEKITDLETVIIGLRPEAFANTPHPTEDAITFEAVIDQTEWLGNEQYGYIPFHAEGTALQTLEELNRELDGEQLRTQVTVSLNARTHIREGEPAQLSFKPSDMHLFNPHTRENLTRDHKRAQQIAEQSEIDRQRALVRAQKQERQTIA
ncbi:ABC transporter ATP-binding protein [Dermatophilus congolensis]|uniref:ABC transporter ATP-binding protein n=1 Tax=Dermatophilus congolensis TaxID=1863 RepID=UPI001AAE68C8|nr:ABC transporter ATP-binding protein [Dermatophilus congolensis]MBO3143143.1 ABC transporter ATP-binding protein [Dermatophilus congolensis]MBO3152129.1 ABC transporter ATP-binding protein [Dermatophilus congolensis]MBO3160858.1 ABC transporter ATP-binding protein [Dermatophilus congolensis]MBO3163417.1 ABC transporter ATP-binding protein [Dermatophilus congolensis]MBO3176967.1 ABC transporter ATP-binding protein [Dermatophilus congolensis]